jgi:hypothetical protein
MANYFGLITHLIKGRASPTFSISVKRKKIGRLDVLSDKDLLSQCQGAELITR